MSTNKEDLLTLTVLMFMNASEYKRRGSSNTLLMFMNDSEYKWSGSSNTVLMFMNACE